MSPDLGRAAARVVHELLAVRPGENVLLIADTESDIDMTQALASQVLAARGDFTIVTTPARSPDESNTLSPPILRALEGADVVIGLTHSCGAPTYHPAVVALLRAKRTRNLSMVMREARHWMGGAAFADYASLRTEGRALATYWATCREARITTQRGTDLHVRVGDAPVFVECGYATEPGEEAAFPDGEVSQMPVEGSAKGVLVVDGPIWKLGVSEQPVRLVVDEGRVQRIEGSSAVAVELHRIVATVPNADNVAELGIGLNPLARRDGDFEEAKKSRGLVHLALGSNTFYGGSRHAAVHMDMVIFGATVALDGVAVVSDETISIPRGTSQGGRPSA